MVKLANNNRMKKTTIIGEVVSGAQKGRKMGFPTANIKLDFEHSNLDNGVYVAEIILDNVHFQGVANIGIHPTVGASSDKLLEVNIFNFDRDIYGKILEVTLLDFIRSEKKFKSLDELIAQITSDKSEVEKIFNENRL